MLATLSLPAEVLCKPSSIHQTDQSNAQYRETYQTSGDDVNLIQLHLPMRERSFGLELDELPPKRSLWLELKL